MTTSRTRPYWTLVALIITCGAPIFGQVENCAVAAPPPYPLRGVESARIGTAGLTGTQLSLGLADGMEIVNDGCDDDAYPGIPTFTSDATLEPDSGELRIEYLDAQAMPYNPGEDGYVAAQYTASTNTIQFFGKCPPGQSYAFCNGAGLIDWHHPAAGTIVAHELLHSLGLGHDTCPNGIMNSVSQFDPDFPTLPSMRDEYCEIADNQNNGGSLTLNLAVTGLGTGQSAYVTLTQTREDTWLDELFVQATGASSNGSKTLEVQRGDNLDGTVTTTPASLAPSCSFSPSQQMVLDDATIAGGTLDVLVACNDICSGGGCYSIGGRVMGRPEMEPTLTVGVSLFAPTAGVAPISDSVDNLGPGSTFQFPTAVGPGWRYSAYIAESPANAQCNMLAGGGVVQTSDITDLFVTCFSYEESNHTIFPRLINQPILSALIGDDFFDSQPRWWISDCVEVTEEVCVIEPNGQQTCASQTRQVCFPTPARPASLTAVSEGPLLWLASAGSGATVRGDLGVSGFAADAVGINAILFFIDSQPVTPRTLTVTESSYSPFGVSTKQFDAVIDTTVLTNGPHGLEVVAVSNDREGVTATLINAPLALVVDNPPPCDGAGPQVSIISPTAGVTLNGQASVSVNAADPNEVDRVVFRIDGSVVGTDYDAPYIYTWNTAAYADGVHQVKVKAFDRCTNVSSAAVYYTTMNNPDLQVLRSGSTVAQGATVFAGELHTFGSWVDTTFQIRNNGTRNLQIINPTSWLTGTCFFPAASPSSTVPPGGVTNFTARYSCSQEGTHTATIRLLSNDPDSGAFTFYAAARTTVPRASVTYNGSSVLPGSSLEIQSAYPGEAVYATMAIKNVGDAPLTVLVQSYPTLCFSVESSPTATVAPGATTTLVVRYLCSYEVPVVAYYELKFNDPYSGSVPFSLRGSSLPFLSFFQEGLVNGGGVYLQGWLPPASYGDSTFTIWNGRASQLQIQNPASLVSAPAGSCITQATVPAATIAPRSSSSFKIRNACTGRTTATLTILSSDPQRSPYVITLEALGGANK